MDRSGHDDELDGPAGPPRGFRRTVTSAFGATFAVLIADRLIDVCFIAVLSRILPPSEFGVAAAAVVVLSFLSQFAQIGLVPALIQAPQLNERILSVAHTLAAFSGVTVFVLTQLFAPLIGGWFHNIQIVDALRISSVACVALGLSVVPHALLARRMRARDLGLIEMLCGIIGTGCCAIPLALMGWSYWALIVGNLVSTVIKTVLLWSIVKMPRRFSFDWSHAKALWVRGAGFSSTVLLHKVATESDRLIVGRFLMPLSLGLYSRANGLMFMPAVFFGGVVDRVAFPAFSRVQTDKTRLREAYGHALALTAFVGLPLTVFLLFVGPDIILFILGPDWGGAIVPFKILCLGTYFRLSDRVSGTILRGLGMPYLMGALQLVLCAAMISGCLWGVRHGLVGVSWAVVAVTALSYALLTTAAVRVVGFSAVSFVKAHGPGVALASLVAIAVGATRIGLQAEELPAAASLALASCAAAISALLAFKFAPSVFLGQAGKSTLATGLAVLTRRF